MEVTWEEPVDRGDEPPTAEGGSAGAPVTKTGDPAPVSGAGEWESLGPGVLRRRLPRWDATVGAVRGADGVLVVDTGAELSEGADIRRELQERLGLPVRWVVLTHPHFDHVLGAGAFTGATVYGARGEGSALDPTALAEDAVRYGLPAAVAGRAARALPDRCHPISGPLRLDLGGGRWVVLAEIGPGHTGADLVVLVPGDGSTAPVVFCGDLVEESGPPQAGPDAQPARWPAALDRLLALGGPHARYVPGHGAVVSAAFVRSQRAELARRFGVAP